MSRVSGANKAALNSINNTLPHKLKIKLRQCKYLNNIIEQDHRSIKRRIVNMTGFNEFESAQRTLSGIEIVNIIRINILITVVPMENGYDPAHCTGVSNVVYWH